MEILPLGDIHLGAQACDEKRFARAVSYIKKNDMYWIGMGDYADYINVRDPRFDVNSIADWLVNKTGLSDMAKAQTDRFLEMIDPIAHRCLGLMKGNHEASIEKHCERSIFYDIVNGVKERGGMSGDEQLGIGYHGWLFMRFHQTSKRKGASNSIKINLHHGFVSGKLAGAKALNMQRWLWTHGADLTLFGHSHNTSAQTEEVVGLDRYGNFVREVRRGAYCGTFLRNEGEGHDTYSERSGYFPLPLGGVQVVLRPNAETQSDRVRLIS